MTDLIQPMPELSPEQLDSLRAEIAENGILVPVVVDQHGRILDGNHRAAIAQELGIEYPTVIVTVEDDADAWDKAVSLNCARRHMSREQVREVIKGEIRRRPDDSDRAIARRIATSPTTVGKVRALVSKLDSVRADLVREGFTMMVHAAADMAKLACSDNPCTAEEIRAAWADGMAQARTVDDAFSVLGPLTLDWVEQNLWLPLDVQLGVDRTANIPKKSGTVLSDEERTQTLESLRDWPTFMAVVVREEWPDIFAQAPPDGWLLQELRWVGASNLDTEAVADA